MGQKVIYTGPGPDGYVVAGHTFERDGDPVEIEDSELAKELLAREDFKPTRSAKADTKED